MKKKENLAKISCPILSPTKDNQIDWLNTFKKFNTHLFVVFFQNMQRSGLFKSKEFSASCI